MWVSAEIQDKLGEVEFFFLNRTATSIYNKRFLRRNQPRIFGGWCWHFKGKEGGPFRSISAAQIDAYYRIFKKQAPPTLHSHGIDSETALQAQRKKKNNVVMLKRKNNG